MSHTIRVTDKVYDRLEAARGKRESFGRLVERLLTLLEALQTLPIGEPSSSSAPRVFEKETDPMREARLERADLESRRLGKEE